MTTATTQHTRPHAFTLVLSGADDITTALEDALFESGCDDATLSFSHGRLWLDFDREAATLEEAVRQAIAEVRRAGVAAGIGLDVHGVDASGLITQAGIARRLDCSRQNVGQLVSKGRGGRPFPAAECHLQEGMPLWRWATVARWLADEGVVAPHVADDADAIERVNESLRAERRGRTARRRRA